jgi:hypothetical protein
MGTTKLFGRCPIGVTDLKQKLLFVDVCLVYNSTSGLDQPLPSGFNFQ